MTKDKHLTVTEASAYTGLSHRTIQRYIALGKLPSIKDEAGVRQIPQVLLEPYVKSKVIGADIESSELKGILLEQLELVPTTDIATLTKKQRLRERVQGWIE